MIDIDFLSGREWDEQYPKRLAAAMAQAGLTQRFAVIQHTYVKGAGEMVFDAALWRTLVDFISACEPGTEARVSVDYDDFGRRDIPLVHYLGRWAETPEEDLGAPACIAIRRDERLRLVMFHENWASVGGPWPYSDSHTYALLSDRDLSDQVMAHLKASRHASGWVLADMVMSPEPKPPLWRRLLNHLLI